MKPSIYNLSTKNPENGETILFNTLYGGTVVIDAETLPAVNRLLEDPGSTSSRRDMELLASLKEEKFLIEDETDEMAIVIKRKQCGIKDKNRADVIIMPNMDCNFACPYCYERHIPQSGMTDEVVNAVKIWLGDVIDSHKLIMMSWFGGEPLLSAGTVLSIGRFTRDRCRKNGISLLTHMTTNGYLFTKPLIDELMDIELFNYQITVDGPPETHNKTRILKNREGTFDRIFDNISLLAGADQKVKITLRVNYNQNNIYAIPALLPMFPENIRPQLRIVFEPIFGNEKLSATRNLEADKISSAITQYYHMAKSLSYDVVLGGLGVGRLVYCYAEREEQYIVASKGDVFKCSVMDFTAENRAGYIDREGIFIKEKAWDDWFAMEPVEAECRSCIFLPLCMGGCRKDRRANKRTGSYCSLIPTNTSYALKAVAFRSFQEILQKEVESLRA